MTQPDTKYLDSLKARYAKASKKERSKILDEYVATTGCHRKHATAVLGGKRQQSSPATPDAEQATLPDICLKARMRPRTTRRQAWSGAVGC